ncbi:MAG: hypothetical protein ACOY90_04040 [Candidatus Zhuqueibacterota bacterium]
MNYRRVSELLVIIFLIGMYVYLEHAAVPNFGYQFARAYKEIDWVKFSEDVMPPVQRQIIPIPTTPGETTLMTPELSTTLTKSEWSEISDLLKNDISSVLNSKESASLVQPPDEKFEYSQLKNLYADPSMKEGQTRVQDNQAELHKISSPISLLSSVKTNASQANELPIDDYDIAIPVDRDRYSESDRPQILTTTTTAATIGIPSTGAPGVTIGKSAFASNRRSTIGTDKVIPETGPGGGQVSSKYTTYVKQNMAIIIDDLMKWMNSNKGSFNRVTESFMMYESGDLTSKTDYVYNGRKFELYLLYKPNVKEIRICMVEGNRSTMLIDDGFKKQSNYLRTGDVSRDGNDSIVLFSTSQHPASEQMTNEFYQIFLMWWEKAKKSIGL